MNMLKKIASGLAVLALVAMIAVAVRAATTDQTQGTGGISAGLRTPALLTGIADFTSVAATNGDVFKVIIVPAGYEVQKVFVSVLATNSAAMTFDVGDSTASNTFLSAISGVVTNLIGISAAKTNLYLAADYISVGPHAAATTGIIQVKALVIPWK